MEGPKARTPKPPVVPITKRIPKIALNFTKWKLQRRMVEELREIKNPAEAAKRIAKYTECFDLLDKLGADNCIDPEDFDQEDLNTWAADAGLEPGANLYIGLRNGFQLQVQQFTKPDFLNNNVNPRTAP